VKRPVRILLSIGWTLAILIPVVYVCAWWVEGIYEVPLAADSFRFERPWAALLLLAAPLVWLARAWIHHERAPRIRLSRTGDLAKVSRASLKSWMVPSLVALRVVAVLLFAIGLMGPQSIHARDRNEVEGIDIVLTLDCSLSMQASDIVPDRFSAMKDVVDEFVRRRPNDRIGAVIFGREAYTLLPLTTDKEALRTMISEMELGMIDGRGTAIGNALGTSLNRLRNSTAESRVIILLTDGDSNSGNVSPEQAGEFAETMGARIYTVLMGVTDDARVQAGTDVFGRPMWDRGSFPVNPELMEELARRTGGAAFVASDRQGLERSFHRILDDLERSEIEDTGRVYGELFPAFVAPALLLLALELLLGTLYLRRWP
jgi:Ca-activated chloride channel family protein